MDWLCGCASVVTQLGTRSIKSTIDGGGAAGAAPQALWYLSVDVI